MSKTGQLYMKQQEERADELLCEIDHWKGRAEEAETALGKLHEALDCCNLFINPDIMELAAGEIDCGGMCEHVSHDYSCNSSECQKSVNGEYCPGDVAVTLQELAKVSRSREGAKP